METFTKKPSRITVPDHCHPLAKVVFAEMARQRVSYTELHKRSKVLPSTFKAWRTENRPGLETMEAVLGALGWALLPVPKVENLPAEVREGLAALTEKWGNQDLLLSHLLASICCQPNPEGVSA